MTYAYDDYVLMPTKDLYDTAVMKMAIEAAKDMYDKGQALMENFYKTYGDFMSPFAADMQKYGAAMDYVRKTVNDAYARGIDLFKSPEGRAIVAQLSHSIDPGWYNRARANAKVGYAYLDSLKDAMKNGTYDRDFLNFVLSKENGGPGAFEDFSSDNGMWNVSGVSKFQDLNQWTHHLFDNMLLTYDPELSKATPGFLAYSKNKDVMNQIAANNMATLANTDMGKYMIDRYAQQFKARGYSDDKALEAAFDMLQRNIVNANYEQSQVKLEQDPYAYLQQSKAADLENFRQKELIKLRISMDLNGDGVVDDEERDLYTSAVKRQLSGQSEDKIPPASVTDELISQQMINENDRRLKYYENANNAKDLLEAYYNSLEGEAKEIAKKYMDYDSRKESLYVSELKSARDIRNKAGKMSKENTQFRRWLDAYNKQKQLHTQAEEAWNRENTTSGVLGYNTKNSTTPPTDEDLYTSSNDIYERNNIVEGLTSEQEKDLSKLLKYRLDSNAKEGEDDYYAYADNTVQFRPVATASMTGTRTYDKSGIVSKVAEIIKNKKYTISSSNIKRTYGSGISNNKRVYTVSETVKFSDPETVTALSKLGDENLAKFGITKEGDGDNASYNVPIVHIYKRSIGTASVNSESDKSRLGTSEAAKLKASRQARELQEQIK